MVELIGGLIITFANIPQILQVLRTQEVAGLNKLTFFLLTIGHVLRLLYAGALGDPYLVITVLTAGSLMLTMFVLIVKYEKPATKGSQRSGSLKKLIEGSFKNE